MLLPVVLSRRAEQDLEESFRWCADNRSLEQAIRWQELCIELLDALPDCAATCAQAPEGAELSLDLRQLALGLGRRPSHRIVFMIRPDMIYVVRLRSLSQQGLAADDL